MGVEEAVDSATFADGLGAPGGRTQLHALFSWTSDGGSDNGSRDAL